MVITQKLALCGNKAIPNAEIIIKIIDQKIKKRSLKRSLSGLTICVPTVSASELGTNVTPPINAVVPSNPCAHIGK